MLKLGGVKSVALFGIFYLSSQEISDRSVQTIRFLFYIHFSFISNGYC